MDNMNISKVDALMAKWSDDGASRGAAFIELRDLARELESAAAPQVVADEREAYDKWIGNKPLHETFSWDAWQARAALEGKKHES